MVNNCHSSYFVPKNEICATIASKNGTTLGQFQVWSPQVNSTCIGLWADAYACASMIGHILLQPAPPVLKRSGFIGRYLIGGCSVGK